MKRILIGILALIMVLGLVGCSSTPADGTNTSEPTKTEKPVETENKTEFTQTVNMGEEIETEWFILSYSDYSIEKNVKGEYYIRLPFSYKNTDTVEHNYQNDFVVQLLYDEKYYYDSLVSTSYSGLAKPLETVTENDSVFIPEEVANTEKPLSIIVTYEPKQGINDKTSGYGTKYKFVIQ